MVGLARVIGFYSGFFPLSILGAQFGASPLPLVFSQVHGVETYSRRFEVQLVMADGRRKDIPGGGAFKRRLHGPFSRVKLYVDAIAFADLSSERRRKGVLRHAFCPGVLGEGVLSRELGIHESVGSILIDLWSAGDRDASLRRYEVKCG